MGTSCICSSNNICQIPTFVWNIYIYYITNVTNEGFLYLWVINLPLIIFLVLLYEDSYDLIRIFIFQSKNNIICTELDICCCILIVGLAFFSFCYKIPKYHAQSRLGMLLQNINKLEKGQKTNKLQYLQNIYICLRMKFKYIH